MENNINVNLENDTLTVLEGMASKPVSEQGYFFTGNIDAPTEVLSKQDLDENFVVILADKEELNITLHIDHHLTTESAIKGVIKENLKLEAFKFNTGESFNMNQVLQLLRFNRGLFKDKNNATIIEKLTDFTAETRLQYNSKDDMKGSYDKRIIREKKNKVDLIFMFETEIYVGEKKHLFLVEIIAEQAESGVVRFYFESIEYEELKEKAIDVIFKRELDKIDGKYVKIIKG